MCKLHNLGISGALWSLINDCHSNTGFSVVENQTSSEWFPVSQGVRQGGVLSTFLYLVYINDLILKIQELSPNIGVFNIPSSNPTLADDTSVLLRSSHKAFRMSSTASSNTPNAGDFDLSRQM